MTLNDYQMLSARTIDRSLNSNDLRMHALHGLVGEVGELHSIYQKSYQGHEFDDEHAKKELGDLLWFIAEYCTAKGWTLEDVCKVNIQKLRERYPNGFNPDLSLHRKVGDI